MHTHRLATTLIALLAALAPGAATHAAAGDPLSEDFVVAQGFGAQSLPKIAMNRDGRTVVVWESFDGACCGRYEIRGQIYEPDGVALNEKGIVHDNYVNNLKVNAVMDDVEQRSPAVAMDASGNFVVVWSPTSQIIHMRRFNAMGVALDDSDIQVNTSTDGSRQKAAVSMAPNGDFVVVWHSNQTGVSTWDIYAQRFNADGSKRGSEIAVNTTLDDEQTFASVAMAENDTFVVAWQSGYQDGDGLGVYARRFYFSSGSAASSEFRVNATTAGHQQNPSVATDAYGNHVVAWEGVDDSGSGIFAQRYNSTGSAEGTEFPVNTTTNDEQTAPRVALDRDGDFVIVWQSGQDGGTGTNGTRGIYARRYSATGLAQGDEFIVNTITDGAQEFPVVATDGDGDFMVAWESPDSSGDGINARRFEGPDLVCAPAPRYCQSTEKSSLKITADKGLAFKWQGYLPLSEIGNPATPTPTATQYAFCLYVDETLVSSAYIQPGQLENNPKLGWAQKKPMLATYKMKPANEYGVLGVKINSKDGDGSKASIKLDGSNLPALPLNPTTGVHVQLVNDRDTCVGNHYNAPLKKDDGKKVQASAKSAS